MDGRRAALAAACCACACAAAAYAAHSAGSPAHGLSVDPVVDRQTLFTTGRVTVHNAGPGDAGGVRVFFDGAGPLEIGTLGAGRSVLLSPPEGSPMEEVVVTADGGIVVAGRYREPPKMVGMMGS